MNVTLSKRWHPLLAVAALASAYVVTGRLGLLLAHQQQNATLIWAPTGLALAGLLLFGLRLWPGVMAGALLVNLLVGTELLPGVLISVGNTLEAVVGAHLLVRVADFDVRFTRLRDVLVFLGLGGLVSPLIGASVGVATLALVDELPTAEAPSVWLTWWLGDAGGAVVVAPLLLVAMRGAPPWRALLRRAETWVVLGLVLVVAVPSFFSLLEPPWLRLWLANLLLPIMAWAGLRLGARGASVALALAAPVAVLGTAASLGPFGMEGPPGHLLLLWAYLTTAAATGLLTAAAVAERAAATQQRLEAERRQRALESRMLHAQRLESLGLLAGGVAHDFNNLLTAVSGNANLLRRGVAPSDQSLIDDILLASDRASQLCRGLLSYSGRGVQASEPVDPMALALDTERLVRPGWPAHVALRVDALEVGLRVVGDTAELGQVLLNLVLNAGQAPAATRVQLRVGRRRVDEAALQTAEFPHRLSAGDHLVFSVEDDGGGIPAEVRPKLFEPFFTTRAGGRGLGLAAVQGIVRAHGGAMLLTTSLGRGTTFEVVLPGVPASDVTPLPADGPALVRPLVVLLADDEPAVLSVTSRMLRRAGHEVIEAVDGQSAVEAFERRARDVDLAMLDLTMPRMGGLSALAALRDLRPDLPVVLMSGFSSEAVNPVELSAVFLAKPFGPDALQPAVERAQQRAAPLGAAPRTARVP